MLLVTLLAPFAAMLVQAAISRSREFEADRAGAEITGRPLWLAYALAAIDRPAQRIDNAPADANPATAHMFIVNPLHGGLSGLFASHPSTEERIARLRAMAGEPAAPCRSLGLNSVVASSEAAGLPARARPHSPSFGRAAASAGRWMPQLDAAERRCAARCRFRPCPGQRDIAPFRRNWTP